MKNKFLSSLRYPAAVGRLLFGAVLLLCAGAGAQELLKNGNFEAPFPVSDPTAGWTLVYADGGPSDFSIAGQSTEASRCCGGHGAHLRGNNWNWAHAYFKQVVTNLTEGAKYTLNTQKMKTAFQYSEGSPPNLQCYATMISGASSNVVHGYSTNIGVYSMMLTCSATREIVIELHMSHRPLSNISAEDFKPAKCTAWFDDFSLTQTP